MSSVVICWFVALMAQLHVATVKADVPEDAPKMRFKAPNVSEEERHSNFMPDQLKCDACRIVAYQVSQHNYKAPFTRCNLGRVQLASD